MGKHSEEHSDKANRISVSMRLPFEIVEAIEEYAAKNGLRKTDAYLHFLQRGIESEGDDLIAKRMDALGEKIDAMTMFVLGLANEKTQAKEKPATGEDLATVCETSVADEAPAIAGETTTPGETSETVSKATEVDEALEILGEASTAEETQTIASETTTSAETPAVEETPESEIERVRAAVEEVAPRYPAILQVYLFGSVARGTANEESNIDLKLELDSRKTLDQKEIKKFCEDVGQLAGREVDVITTLLLHNKPLVEAYEREKVLVYERAHRFSLPSI